MFTSRAEVTDTRRATPRAAAAAFIQSRGDLLRLGQEIRLHVAQIDGHRIVFLDDQPLAVHLAIDIGRPVDNFYLRSVLPGKFAGLDVVS
jgi:hypothetical protein